MSVINPIIKGAGVDISDANAAVGDVLASKTFYAGSGGKKTGTMTDRGTVNTDITTKAQEVTIADGYHNGSGKVKIAAAEQAKIIAGNIKKDVAVLGVTGTYEGGVPLEQFVEFYTDHSGSMGGTRLLTFFSRNPRGWDTQVDTQIYYKDETETEVLLVSKYISYDTVNFIVIPRSYGTLKIVMSLVPDVDYGWNGFSGFYAKDAKPNVVTQLTPPDYQEDFVLSYVDFDVFHVVFTAYGE